MRKNYRSSCTRLLCALLAGIFLTTQGPVLLLAETLQNPVLKVREISVPEKIGRVEEVYVTPECRIPGSARCSGKQIIFIQDAHSSIEAQKNISNLIGHFIGEGVRTVYQEGYEGPVPTDSFFAFIQNPEVKERVSYFFLDKLRIGGAEYAHINRKKDFRLIGADSIKLHRENIRQYQISARHQKEISDDLNLLFGEVNALGARFFSQIVKDFLKLRERYDENKIELTDYLGRVRGLAVKTEFKSRGSEYPLIELVLTAKKSNDPALIRRLQDMDPRDLFAEISRYENDFSRVLLKTDREQKIYLHLKELLLIKRLNDLEVTPQEYDSVRQTLETVNTSELARWISGEIKKTVVLSKAWELSIRHAMKFYDIAAERDKFIDQSLEGFFAGRDEKEAVLVFGGFHKRNIETFLRRSGVSYTVVSPRMSAEDPVHEKYYKRLMTVGSHAYETPAALAHAARPESLMTLPGARSEIRNVYTVALENPGLEFSIFDRRVLKSFEFSRQPSKTESTSNPKSDSRRSEVRSSSRGTAYFKENKIPYELAVLFSPQVLAELIADLSMEPVYMVDMMKVDGGAYLQAPEYMNGPLLEKIGGLEMLAGYAGFTIGDQSQALEALKQGIPLIVGMRDRSDAKKNFKFSVASERQVYFPLGYGLWLGVKGSGLSGNGENNFYFNHEKNKWWGLVTQQEAERAVAWTEALEGKGRRDLLVSPGGPAVQTLAVQGILAIPGIKAGKVVFTKVSGGFDIMSMDYGWEHTMVPLYSVPVQAVSRVIEPLQTVSPFPRLVFNLFTGSPHRFEKFFQVLDADPKFARTRAGISKALVGSGELEAGDVLSESAWMTHVIKNLGADDGVRGMNYDLGTIQAQDFTLSGQRADNEEIIKISPRTDYPGAELISSKGHGLHSVVIKLRMVLAVMARLGGEMETYFPKPRDTLQTFFEAYFRGLPLEDLELWANGASAASKKPRPLASLDQLVRMDLFHPRADWNVIHKTEFEIEEKKKFTRPGSKFFDRQRHSEILNEIGMLAARVYAERRSELRVSDEGGLENAIRKWMDEGSGRFSIKAAGDQSVFTFVFERDDDPLSEAERFNVTVFNKGSEAGYVHAKFFKEGNIFLLDVSFEEGVLARNKIEAVFVRPAMRREYSGIGRSLMGILMRLARSAGASEIIVKNAATEDFYHALGFEVSPAGALDDYIFEFSRSADEKLPEVGIRKRSEVRSEDRIKPEPPSWHAKISAWKLRQFAIEGRIKLGNFEKRQLFEISKGRRITREMAGVLLQLLEKSGAVDSQGFDFEDLKNYLLNVSAGLELYVSVPDSLRNVQGVQVAFGDADLEWNVPSAADLTLGQIEDAYGNGFLQFPFLSRTFAAAVRDSSPDLPVPPIGNLREVRTQHVQEGRTEGIFSADFTVDDERYAGEQTPRVIFSVSRAEGFNHRLEKSYLNMRRLGRIYPLYVPRVYASARGIFGYHSSGAPRYLSMYSMQRLYGYTEINNNLENGTILVNGYPDRMNEDLTPAQSSLVKNEMIKIVTVYFERAYQVYGRRLMLGYINRGNGEFTGGPHLQAGDFMLDTSRIAQGQDFLRLITARELREKTIPEFIQLLLAAPIGAKREEKQFSPENILQGIDAALIELYGAERGRQMADEWLDAYEAAYDVPGFFMRSEVRGTGSLSERILQDQKNWFESLSEEERKGSSLGAKIYEDLRQVTEAIDKKIAEGKIKPYVSLRLNKLSPDTVDPELAPPEEGRRIRAGVLAITANPLTWGHVLTALHSIEQLNLDTVIFIVQGVVTYKGVDAKDQVPIEARAQTVIDTLKKFSPLLRFSDISNDTSRIGEDSWHQLRDLNPETDIDFIYLAGSEDPGRVVRIMNNLKVSAEKHDLLSSPHGMGVGFLQRGQSFTQTDLDKLKDEVGMSGEASVVEVPPLLADEISSTRYRKEFDPAIVPKEVHDTVISRGFYRSEMRALSNVPDERRQTFARTLLTPLAKSEELGGYSRVLSSAPADDIRALVFQQSSFDNSDGTVFNLTFNSVQPVSFYQTSSGAGSVFPVGIGSSVHAVLDSENPFSIVSHEHYNCNACVAFGYNKFGKREVRQWHYYFNLAALGEVSGKRLLLSLPEFLKDLTQTHLAVSYRGMDTVYPTAEEMTASLADLNVASVKLFPRREPLSTVVSREGLGFFVHRDNFDYFQNPGARIIEASLAPRVKTPAEIASRLWLWSWDDFTQIKTGSYRLYPEPRIIIGLNNRSEARFLNPGEVVTGEKHSYRILSLKNSGFADVFEAEEVDTGRRALIKYYSYNSGSDVEKSRVYYAQEAAALRELGGGKYYPSLYDQGRNTWGEWSAIERIEGIDLDEWLFSPRSDEERMKVMDLIFEAVDDFHARGLVHHDLKPGNFLITPGGEIKIIDFEGTFREGTEGTPSFTYSYAPGELQFKTEEQVKAQKASDLFSLALIFIEMGTGSLIEDIGRKSPGFWIRQDDTNSRLFADKLPETWKKFAPIVTGVLKNDPGDRTRSVTEMRRMFNSLRSAPRSELRTMSGGYQERSSEDFAEDILKIMDIHYANAEKDESLSFLARERAKQAGNQIVPVEAKYIAPFFQRRADALSMTLRQYRDFWRLILESRDFSSEEYKLYESIFDFTVSRLELNYPMANFDRERVVSNSVKSMIAKRLNSEGPVKPLVFRFAALGDGGELLEVSKMLDAVLREILLDPGYRGILESNKISDSAALARYLKLEFYFYDIRSWKLEGLEKQVERLRESYSWLPEKPVYEFSNLAIAKTFVNWEADSTSFLIARNLFSAMSDVLKFAEKISPALEEGGVYIVNPNDASLIIWREESLKLKALDSYPAVHNDYHVRVFSPAERSEMRTVNLDVFSVMEEPTVLMDAPDGRVRVKIRLRKNMRLGDLYRALGTFLDWNKDYLLSGGEIVRLLHVSGGEIQLPPSPSFNKTAAFKGGSEFYVEILFKLSNVTAYSRDLEKAQTANHLITGFQSRLSDAPSERTIVDLGAGRGDLLSRLLHLFGKAYAVERDRHSIGALRRAHGSTVNITEADFFENMPDLFPNGGEANVVLSSHSFYTPNLSTRIRAITDSFKYFKSSGTNHFVFVLNDLDHPEPYSRTLMRDQLMERPALNPDGLWSIESFMRAAGFEVENEYFTSEHVETSPDRMFLLALSMLPVEEREDPQKRARLMEYVRTEAPNGLKVPGENRYRILNQQKIIWAKRSGEYKVPNVAQTVSFPVEGGRQILVKVEDGRRPFYALMNVLDKKQGQSYAAQVFYPGSRYFLYDNQEEVLSFGRVKKFSGILRLNLRRNDSPFHVQFQAVPISGGAFQVLINSTQPLWIGLADQFLEKLRIEDKEGRLVAPQEIPARFRFSNPSLTMLESISNPGDKWVLNEGEDRYKYSKRSEARSSGIIVPYEITGVSETGSQVRLGTYKKLPEDYKETWSTLYPRLKVRTRLHSQGDFNFPGQSKFYVGRDGEEVEVEMEWAPEVQKYLPVKISVSGQDKPHVLKKVLAVKDGKRVLIDTYLTQLLNFHKTLAGKYKRVVLNTTLDSKARLSIMGKQGAAKFSVSKKNAAVEVEFEWSSEESAYFPVLVKFSGDDIRIFARVLAKVGEDWKLIGTFNDTVSKSRRNKWSAKYPEILVQTQIQDRMIFLFGRRQAAPTNEAGKKADLQMKWTPSVKDYLAVSLKMEGDEAPREFKQVEAKINGEWQTVDTYYSDASFERVQIWRKNFPEIRITTRLTDNGTLNMLDGRKAGMGAVAAGKRAAVEMVWDASYRQNPGDTPGAYLPVSILLEGSTVPVWFTRIFSEGGKDKTQSARQVREVIYGGKSIWGQLHSRSAISQGNFAKVPLAREGSIVTEPIDGKLYRFPDVTAVQPIFGIYEWNEGRPVLVSIEAGGTVYPLNKLSSHKASFGDQDTPFFERLRDRIYEKWSQDDIRQGLLLKLLEMIIRGENDEEKIWPRLVTEATNIYYEQLHTRSELRAELQDELLNKLPADEKNRIDTAVRFLVHIKSVLRTRPSLIADGASPDGFAFEGIPGNLIYSWVDELIREDEFAFINEQWQPEAFGFLRANHPDFKKTKWSFQLISRVYAELERRSDGKAAVSSMDVFVNALWRNLEEIGLSSAGLDDAIAAIIARMEENIGLRREIGFVLEFLDRISIYAEGGFGEKTDLARQFLRIFTRRLFESQAMELTFNFNRSLVEGVLTPSAGAPNAGLVYIFSGSGPLYDQAVRIAEARGLEARRIHALSVNRAIEQGDREMLREYLVQELFKDGQSKYEVLYLMDSGFHGTMMTLIADVLATIPNAPKILHGRMLYLNREPYTHTPPASTAERTSLSLEVLGWNHVMGELGMFPTDKHEAALLYMVHILDTALAREKKSPVSLERNSANGKIEPQAPDTDVPVFAAIAREELLAGVERYLGDTTIRYPDLSNPAWNSWFDQTAVENLKRSEMRVGGIPGGEGLVNFEVLKAALRDPSIKSFQALVEDGARSELDHYALRLSIDQIILEDLSLLKVLRDKIEMIKLADYPFYVRHHNTLNDFYVSLTPAIYERANLKDRKVYYASDETGAMDKRLIWSENLVSLVTLPKDQSVQNQMHKLLFQDDGRFLLETIRESLGPAAEAPLTLEDLDGPLLMSPIQAGQYQRVFVGIAPLKGGRRAAFAVLISYDETRMDVVKEEFNNSRALQGIMELPRTLAFAESQNAAAYSAEFMNGLSEIIFFRPEDFETVRFNYWPSFPKGQKPPFGLFILNGIHSLWGGAFDEEDTRTILRESVKEPVKVFLKTGKKIVGISFSRGDFQLIKSYKIPGSLSPNIKGLVRSGMSFKFIAPRNLQAVSAGQFLDDLFSLSYLLYDEFPVSEADNVPQSIVDGVLDAVVMAAVESLGKEDGLRKAEELLSGYDFETASRRRKPGFRVFTREKIAAYLSSLPKQTFYRRSELRVPKETVLLEPSETPLNWKEIFGNDNPIQVNVGVAGGAELWETARKFPGINFVGFENDGWANRRRLELNKDVPSNVRIVIEDAREGIGKMFQDGEITGVNLIFFPPYSIEYLKRGLAAMVQKLKPGGKIVLITEEGSFSDQFESYFRDQPGFSVSSGPYSLEASPETPQSEMAFGSEFRRMFGAGNLSQVTAVKLSGPEEVSVPAVRSEVRSLDRLKAKIKTSRAPLQIVENEQTWGTYKSTLGDLDLWMETAGLEKISELILQKARALPKGQRLTVVDWGAGNGQALLDLYQLLKRNRLLKKVRLVGFGDAYFDLWLEGIQKGINFVLADAETIDNYFKPGEIDFIYSHLGLYHLSTEDEPDLTARYVERKLAPLLAPGGKIITDVSQEDAEFLQKKFQVRMGGDIAVVENKTAAEIPSGARSELRSAEAWTDYWLETDHLSSATDDIVPAVENFFYDFIVRAVRDDSKAKLLDVGTGRFIVPLVGGRVFAKSGVLGRSEFYAIDTAAIDSKYYPKFEGFRFIRMPIQKIPESFPKGSFAAVTSSYGADYAGDWDAALRDINYVLKVGGRFRGIMHTRDSSISKASASNLPQMQWVEELGIVQKLKDYLTDLTPEKKTVFEDALGRLNKKANDVLIRDRSIYIRYQTAMNTLNRYLLQRKFDAVREAVKALGSPGDSRITLTEEQLKSAVYDEKSIEEFKALLEKNGFKVTLFEKFTSNNVYLGWGFEAVKVSGPAGESETVLEKKTELPAVKKIKVAAITPQGIKEIFDADDLPKKLLPKKDPRRSDVTARIAASLEKVSDREFEPSDVTSAMAAGGLNMPVKDVVLALTRKLNAKFTADESLDGRSEVRTQGPDSDLNALENITMKVLLSDEEVSSSYREPIERGGEYSGVSPSLNFPIMASALDALEFLFEGPAPSEIATPLNFAGSSVLLIGPSRGGDDLAEFIQKYPAVREIHIADVNDEVFAGNNRKLRELKARGTPIPKIYGYKVNALRLPEELSSKMDAVFHLGVVDDGYFSASQQSQFGREVSKVLKPGAVAFSMYFSRRDIHEGDESIISLPSESSNDLLRIHIKKGHSRSEARASSDSLREIFGTQISSVVDFGTGDGSWMISLRQRPVTWVAAGASVTGIENEEPVYYHEYTAAFGIIEDDWAEYVEAKRKRGDLHIITKNSEEPVFGAEGPAVLHAAFLPRDVQEDRHFARVLDRLPPGGWVMIANTKSLSRPEDWERLLISHGIDSQDVRVFTAATGFPPDYPRTFWWNFFPQQDNFIVVAQKKTKDAEEASARAEVRVSAQKRFDISIADKEPSLTDWLGHEQSYLTMRTLMRTYPESWQSDVDAEFISEGLAKESRFSRHAEQYEDFEQDLKRKIKGGQKDFEIHIYGPGFWQEAIEIYLRAQRAFRESGLGAEEFKLRINVYDYDDRFKVSEKAMAGEIYYDPEDAAVLEKSGFDPEEIFTRETRGLRFVPDAEVFKAVNVNLQDLKDFQKTAKPESADYVFMNQIYGYLTRDHEDDDYGAELWNELEKVLKPGAVFYMGNFTMVESMTPPVYRQKVRDYESGGLSDREWKVGRYDKPVRSEARFTGALPELNVRENLNALQTPAIVYLDYKNLIEKFWNAESKTWNEQGIEIIKLAHMHAEKIRLVIYGADITDERLKPFRELRESRRNVRITKDEADQAYEVTQKDFVKGLKKYVNIHLSKDFSGVKNTFAGAAKDEMYFFRYQTEDQSAGLLAAALLWADYEEAGKKMDGFTRDAEGFLVLSEGYLRALVQSYEAKLVVAFSA